MTDSAQAQAQGSSANLPTADDTIHVAPSTPNSRHQAIAPHTPGTKASVTYCSSNAEDFSTVSIHTAKCSECDKRNMATMRRCPGCTFQICQPCFRSREAAGKTLAHGNNQSPAVTSAVRRRPFQLGRGQQQHKGHEQKQQEGTRAREMKQEMNAGPEESRSLAKEATKRTGKRKAVDPLSEDEEYRPNPAFPKQLRGLKMSGNINQGYGQGATGSSMPGQNLTTEELMQQLGVNTPANPYQQHLLGRHVPLIAPNPAIYIPETVRRNFKPRLSEEEVAKNIRDKVRAKLHVGQGGSTETAPSSESARYSDNQGQDNTLKNPSTIRELVEAEVANITCNAAIGRDPLTKDKQKYLMFTVKKAACLWAVHLYFSLAEDFKKIVMPGIDMELDQLNEVQTESLLGLLNEGAWNLIRDYETGKVNALPTTDNAPIDRPKL